MESNIFAMRGKTEIGLRSVKHIKPRPASHCRLLPLGAFNGMMPEPLTSYYVIFITAA